MSAIAKIYARQIIAGKKKFKNVPEHFKPEVKELLIAEGHPELVEE